MNEQKNLASSLTPHTNGGLIIHCLVTHASSFMDHTLWPYLVCVCIFGFTCFRDKNLQFISFLQKPILHFADLWKILRKKVACGHACIWSKIKEKSYFNEYL